MKKLTLIVLAISFLGLFASCSKDDPDGEDVVDYSIAGKWALLTSQGGDFDSEYEGYEITTAGEVYRIQSLDSGASWSRGVKLSDIKNITETRVQFQGVGESDVNEYAYEIINSLTLKLTLNPDADPANYYYKKVD